MASLVFHSPIECNNNHRFLVTIKSKTKRYVVAIFVVVVSIVVVVVVKLLNILCKQCGKIVAINVVVVTKLWNSKFFRLL